MKTGKHPLLQSLSAQNSFNSILTNLNYCTRLPYFMLQQSLILQEPNCIKLPKPDSVSAQCYLLMCRHLWPSWEENICQYVLMMLSHVAGKTQPAQQYLTQFMFSSGDHSYLWFHPAVRESFTHILPHMDILWILELAGCKSALWGLSGKRFGQNLAGASAGKQSSIKECPKCLSLWASTVEAWGQEILFLAEMWS